MPKVIIGTLKLMADFLRQFQNDLEPIHVACFKGQENVLQLLVDTYKVKPTRAVKVCLPLLHDHTKIPCSYYPAPIHTFLQHGLQPMHLAAMGGQETTIDFLVRHYNVSPTSMVRSQLHFFDVQQSSNV